MNTQSNDTCSIMFADVVGSTRLYEELGDVIANSIISEVLGLMQKIIIENQGTVIKTIGDEVMSSFVSVDDCARAAIAIQEKLDSELIQDTYIAVRIGFHAGETIVQKDGDVFGDTVNTAARMAGIARARQIILSQTTADFLATDLKNKTRIVDKVQVKGKSEELSISELVWEDAGVTQLISFENFVTQLKQDLVFEYKGKEFLMTRQSKNLQLGRSETSDLVVDTELVSRFHASVRLKRGCFVLVDQSTNGTYVKTEDGNLRYLKRDELVLQGEGVISLGRKIIAEDSNLIKYRLEFSS